MAQGQAINIHRPIQYKVTRESKVIHIINPQILNKFYPTEIRQTCIGLCILPAFFIINDE